MNTVFCEDIREAFRCDCCGSCHAEWAYFDETGYGSQPSEWEAPPKTPDGIPSDTTAFMCCASNVIMRGETSIVNMRVVHSIPDSQIRTNYARALWAQRRRKRRDDAEAHR